MRVYFLTKYGYSGASSRYRILQYLPAIESAGFHAIVSSLFDDEYLANKYYKGVTRLYNVFFGLIRRLRVSLSVRRGTIVFIEYELFPYLPLLVERWLVWRRCKLIIDYDDAIFHRYDTQFNPLIRKVLGRKIAKLMRVADTVVVGNHYLADYARLAGAERVVTIPTVVDLSRYTRKSWSHSPGTFTIGWIGSPTTAPYLREIAAALSKICEAGRARVCVVGSGSIVLSGVPLEIIPWREETEVEEIRKFDIGIMPLPDEPWTRGKCGFKLIQYMACGLPVLASPVGVNKEIVEHGINGYLASTTEEWVHALESLRVDAELRYRMGLAGRRKVEEKYCLAVTSPKMVETIKQCAV